MPFRRGRRPRRPDQQYNDGSGRPYLFWVQAEDRPYEFDDKWGGGGRRNGLGRATKSRPYGFEDKWGGGGGRGSVGRGNTIQSASWQMRWHNIWRYAVKNCGVG